MLLDEVIVEESAKARVASAAAALNGISGGFP